jgi:hypothetical protein
LKTIISKMNNSQSFLFAPVNPESISVFKILVALIITVIFSQKGLTPIYTLTEFPILCEYMFSVHYNGLMYLLILSFAFGIGPQIIAILLFIILLPHDFLIQGRKSKQVILCVLFHLSLNQVVNIFMLDYVSMFLYLAFIIPFNFGAKDILVRNN